MHQNQAATNCQLSQQELCVLANGQAMFEQLSTYKMLLSSCIYPKMMGLNSSTKNIAEFVVQPYLLDKYSTAYLLKNKIMICNQKISNKNGVANMNDIYTNPLYIAYQYLLKTRELYLVDGHKFGGDFLAYQNNPDSNHATYLVFVKTKTASNECPLDHISRLAGICKKQALVVTVSYDKNQQYFIQCQEVKPKFLNDAKKQSQVTATQQVQRLKKMLGYKLI